MSHSIELTSSGSYLTNRAAVESFITNQLLPACLQAIEDGRLVEISRPEGRFSTGELSITVRVRDAAAADRSAGPASPGPAG